MNRQTTIRLFDVPDFKFDLKEFQSAKNRGDDTHFLSFKEYYGNYSPGDEVPWKSWWHIYGPDLMILDIGWGEETHIMHFINEGKYEKSMALSDEGIQEFKERQTTIPEYKVVCECRIVNVVPENIIDFAKAVSTNRKSLVELERARDAVEECLRNSDGKTFNDGMSGLRTLMKHIDKNNDLVPREYLLKSKDNDNREFGAYLHLLDYFYGDNPKTDELVKGLTRESGRFFQKFRIDICEYYTTYNIESEQEKEKIKSLYDKALNIAYES